MNTLIVAIGGILGAIARYECGSRLFKKDVFPVSTLFINLLGSFLLGIIVFLYVEESSFYMFFAIGFLGAFTTFSTFSVEAMNLFLERKWNILVAYVFLTIVGTISCFLLSTHFIHFIFS